MADDIVNRLREAHPNSAQRFAGSNILLDAAAHIEALQRRVEELEAALKPFADRANRYNEVPGIIQFDDSCELWQLEKNKGMEVDITVGDLRRARAALIPQEQKKDR